MNKKKAIIALTIVNLVMLPMMITVACGPDTPETTFLPEEAASGDPALYAPEGWSLRIGDTLSMDGRYAGEWGDFVDQFPSVDYLGYGLRVVNGVVYKAGFRPVDILEPGADPLTAVSGFEYRGHVPVEFFWLHDDHVLPPQLKGVREVHTYEDAITKGLVARPRYTPDGRLIKHGPRPDTVPVGRVYGREER